jgi:hypothetical protein
VRGRGPSAGSAHTAVLRQGDREALRRQVVGQRTAVRAVVALPPEAAVHEDDERQTVVRPGLLRREVQVHDAVVMVGVPQHHVRRLSRAGQHGVRGVLGVLVGHSATVESQ